MKFFILLSSTALTLSSIATIANAQAPNADYPPKHPMAGHHHMPLPQHRPYAPPIRMQRPAIPEFPTPQELSRMAPPEPMTEEKIKQRFAKRLEHLTETLQRDRKSAEKYAQDFARMQKHQADRLADIMAHAEKRREAMIERLKQQETQALEQFRNHQMQKKQQEAPKEET